MRKKNKCCLWHTLDFLPNNEIAIHVKTYIVNFDFMLLISRKGNCGRNFGHRGLKESDGKDVRFNRSTDSLDSGKQT